MAVQEQVYGFFIPSITLVGIGASKEIPKKIRTLGGKKPLVVTDQGIVKSGILKQITDLLDDAKMKYEVYDKTIPNPTDANVHEGVDVYKKAKCDSLITLGGGSSHDCGKGIGLVVSNGGKIHDYEGVDQSTKPLPPYVAVNTTAGTASEMTRFCIITDLSRKVKMAIVDWRVTPNIALDDPLLMVGMPPSLTAATGMDALTHSVEAYVSSHPHDRRMRRKIHRPDLQASASRSCQRSGPGRTRGNVLCAVHGRNGVQQRIPGSCACNGSPAGRIL